jgi:hypothetical protein
VDALVPRRILLGRDSRRQTTADLFQLLRVIEVGMDPDGDGNADLDASRVYYAGFSAGTHVGLPFVALEPGVRAAAFNAAGGLVGERLRLSPVSRPDLGAYLGSRQPSLTNLAGNAFDERLPPRGAPPLVNDVPGASEIQQVLERMEWAYMPGDAVGFAPYLRDTSLFQLAQADRIVPNPATTAILRAGDLAATLYRTDLALAAYGSGPAAVPPPAVPAGVEENGHNFLVRMNSPIRTAIARAAQEQIATYFETDGVTVRDPDEFGLLLPSVSSQVVPALFEPLNGLGLEP